MKRLDRLFLLVLTAYLLFKSIQGFQKIAFGTGAWWQEYSFKWGIAYSLYILVCILVLALTALILWKRKFLSPLIQILLKFRDFLGVTRPVLALAIFAFPIWFFQYTAWGLVFSDLYIRVLIWVVVVFVLSYLISKAEIVEMKRLLAVTLLTSSAFVIAVSFINVTDYPFSLGWSEGNRMWDYSILFGRDLYDYPPDKNIPVLLDIGRQFVGGLPFLLPGITIEFERFWIALTVIVPYLLLGLAVFRFFRSDLRGWLFAVLWSLIFLKQGPIHPPLVLCAAATALVWRSPLWIGIPLIAATGFFAEASRFTWVFAPGLWIGMLELAGAILQDYRLTRTAWYRALSLGLAGVIGGQYGESLLSFFDSDTSVTASISVDSAVAMVATPSQPLLWYRLLPNETYPLGVLFGLLFATLPLIVVLIYLIASRKWFLNAWQGVAIVAPLTAFLVVGLIVSAKIGGGGDLHNMDMYLIGLLFVSVIAWEKAGKQWFDDFFSSPPWIKCLLVFLFALPGVFSLGGMRSFSFIGDVPWLAVLLDVSNERALDMYPSAEVIENSLSTIRQEVEQSKTQGEVLFIDQRQLLTFGYIKDVPFIPEYEKKVLMNNALGARRLYFEQFYADLEAKRFTLIISEPLRTPVRDSSARFGEENNAWVTWVSTPVLCYYESKVNLAEVGVQLLVPKSEPVDCSGQLP